MNDHVSEQKYFHEVDCIFKRWAVLQTLSNKDEIVEYLSKQAWGFLTHYVCYFCPALSFYSHGSSVAIIHAHKLEISEDQVSLLQEGCFK